MISFKDDGADQLSPMIKRLMASKGSNLDQLQNQVSYVSVINNGVLENKLIDNSHSLGIKRVIGNYEISLKSWKERTDNNSEISVDGHSLSPNKRGLNVVVLETFSGRVGIYNFDTAVYRYHLKTGHWKYLNPK